MNLWYVSPMRTHVRYPIIHILRVLQIETHSIVPPLKKVSYINKKKTNYYPDLTSCLPFLVAGFVQKTAVSICVVVNAIVVVLTDRSID